MIRDMPDHAQTIAYPAPGARPHRFDLDALAPHVIVLFGATGDLAKRKLIPGLAYLDQSSIAPEIRIVGTSLEDITTEDFRALARRAVDAFGTHKPDEDTWTKFSQKLTHVPQSAGPEGLTAAVKAAEIELGPNSVTTSCTCLRKSSCATSPRPLPTSRPFRGSRPSRLSR